MSRLAFLAALLMVLMPTVSRVLAAQAPPSWAELCSTSGGHGDSGLPSLHAGGDCGYCVLGAPVPPPRWQAPLPTVPPATHAVPVDAPPRARPVRLCGLGAQGPPLPL